MTHNNILRLEDMQNMTIDQIVSLYREGYTIEYSNIKNTQNIKSMQNISSTNMAEILFIGVISSFVGSYIFHSYYEKNRSSSNKCMRVNK